MDEQLLADFILGVAVPTVQRTRVVSVEDHPVHGILVNARGAARDLQLIPLHPGRLFSSVEVGDIGLALLADRDSDQGYYLAGALILGQLAEGWNNTTTRLEARGDLELKSPEASIYIDAGQEITLQGGDKGAARLGDAIKVTIPAGASAAVTELAVALLTTGLFIPTAPPPPVVPPATVLNPITFDGEITEGSAEVKIGG